MNKKEVYISDMVKQDELYYAIGSMINELIEEYHLEDSHNKILKSFSEKLTREFGEDYSVPNLKLMKKFYLEETIKSKNL